MRKRRWEFLQLKVSSKLSAYKSRYLSNADKEGFICRWVSVSAVWTKWTRWWSNWQDSLSFIYTHNIDKSGSQSKSFNLSGNHSGCLNNTINFPISSGKDTSKYGKKRFVGLYLFSFVIVIGVWRLNLVLVYLTPFVLFLTPFKFLPSLSVKTAIEGRKEREKYTFYLITLFLGLTAIWCAMTRLKT